MILLDGKFVAADILQKLKLKISDIVSTIGRSPRLAVILVGSDPASTTYIQAKKKACEQVGIEFELFSYQNISSKELLVVIDILNERQDVDGMIVQLPIPNICDGQEILDRVVSHKDVDGFSSHNYGKMARNSTGFYHISATPQGILMLLRHYNIDLSGKKCVILGRGTTVGAPLSILLSSNRIGCNATVTVCHSLSKDIGQYTKEADILISAVGMKNFVSAQMVKEGVIVIDVGITRFANPNTKSGYSICGDVEFAEVSKIASYITPVPGGVGPMTIASLLTNVVKAVSQSSDCLK